MQHMEFLKLSILIAQLICGVCGKVVIIPDTKLEDCTNSTEAADIFDFSQIDLIPETDEHVYINGTWKFLKELKKPWKAHLQLERYNRGEWLVQALDKDYDDFCEPLHRITEPWYYAFEGKESCPVPAGTEWFFDHVLIKFPEALLDAVPSHYMGRWRFVMIAIFDEDDGSSKKDCKRVYADVYEV